MTKLFRLFALSLAFFLFTAPANAVPIAPKKPALSARNLAEVEAEAKKAQQEKQQLEKQAQKIKNELNEVNRKMISAAQKIQDGEDMLRQKQEELEKLQQHLSESELKFRAENDILIGTLSALQNLALRPSEAVLVQPLSPVEVMRSSILLRGSVHSLRERAEIIRQNIEDIGNQKAEIAKRLADLEKQNKQLAQQQTELKKLSQQKGKMYDQVSSQSKEAQQRATQLASQAVSLRDLVEKLEKQKELQRKQQEEKAKLARIKAADDARASKSVGASASNFGRSKGKLFYPARGPIVTKFHEEMSKGVVSNGIDIKTAKNAQVVAPFDGTVIFAGPFKNFANLLIIDHGDGFTSLLSGLGETDAKVGQMLLAGEPVGTMSSGQNTKLHMEIRKDSRPINPQEWLSAK